MARAVRYTGETGKLEFSGRTLANGETISGSDDVIDSLSQHPLFEVIEDTPAAKTAAKTTKKTATKKAPQEK